MLILCDSVDTYICLTCPVHIPNLHYTEVPFLCLVIHEMLSVMFLFFFVCELHYMSGMQIPEWCNLVKHNCLHLSTHTNFEQHKYSQQTASGPITSFLYENQF